MPRIRITAQLSPQASSAPSEVIIPPDRVLLQPRFLRRIATLLAKLNIPRRSVPNWIADTIYDFEGEITDSDGSRFRLYPDDIDEAFSNEGSFRWISDFVKLKDQPWKQSPQRRVLARIRLIVLCLIICGLLESWGEAEITSAVPSSASLDGYRRRKSRTTTYAVDARAIQAMNTLLSGRGANPIWMNVHQAVIKKIRERL
nr:hypothetical protein [Brucella intermedia]